MVGVESALQVRARHKASEAGGDETLIRSWDRKDGRQVSLVLVDRCCGAAEGPSPGVLSTPHPSALGRQHGQEVESLGGTRHRPC